MALVCDTSAIYALYDADDRHHTAVKTVVEAERGLLLLPVILLAEIDYLFISRLGVQAARDFLESVEDRVFELIQITPEDLARCRELLTQHMMTCSWALLTLRL
jgi:uncharacterized protein